MVIYILRLGKCEAININVNTFRSLLHISQLTSPHLLTYFYIQLYHSIISLQVNVYISSFKTIVVFMHNSQGSSILHHYEIQFITKFSCIVLDS